MAVVDIQSELAARNPGRAKDEIAKSLQVIDQQITMLSLAKDSAALSEADDTLIRGLQMIHGRLRRECDRLFQIL